MRILSISWNETKPFCSLAAKEHVSLAETSRTEWFGVFEEDLLIGVGALLRRSGIARIKGIFLMKEYRGKGYGDAITRFLIQRAMEENFGRIEAFVWKPEWYIKNGFKIDNTLPNGAIKVWKNI